MDWKTWTPLAVALVLGVIAAKMTRDVIVRSRASTTAPSELVGVVVAREDLPPGTELTADHLEVKRLHADEVPERVFAETDDLVGRVTELHVVKGQAMVPPMLAEVGSGSGLQALVPVGMRAITVEVNEFSGVAGMLAPGCRVDVVATFQPSGGGASVARTVVENVRVTAVGRRVGGAARRDAGAAAQGDNGESADDAAKSVTLLVSPEQAEAIELTTASSRPRLVLRSGRDQQPAKPSGVSLAQLLGTFGSAEPRPAAGDPFAAAATPQPPPAVTEPAVVMQAPSPPTTAPAQRTVQVIRAGVESAVQVDVPAPEQPATPDRQLRHPPASNRESELMTQMPFGDE